MTLSSALLFVVLAHLYVHLALVLALYIAPIGRFACGEGYRFWPARWPEKLVLFGYVVYEFWVFYLFIVWYPIGWLMPRRLRLPAHPDPDDPRNVPVILLHGYMMNRFCMAPLRLYLRLCGFRRLYSLGLRQLYGPIEGFAHQLRDLVIQVDRENPGEGVYLIGHSMGGLVSALTLKDKAASAHIRGIIAIGSPFAGTILHSVALGVCARQFRPDGVFVRRLGGHLAAGVRHRLVSIYSDADRMVLPPSSAHVPGALANERLHGPGHLSLLMSPRVFRLVRDHLLGRRSRPFPDRPHPTPGSAVVTVEEHALEHSGEERDLAPHP